MPDHHLQKQSNASVRHAIILGIFPALGWILAMAQPNWLQQQSISPTPSQPAQSPFPTPDSSSRSGVPQWSIDPNFESEVFTFVRIQYDSYGGWGAWRVDYPAADLNFSYRLEELTSMRVHPDGKILRLDDLELNQYPFIFMIDARNLFLSDRDAQVLRNYLLAGGFLMLDDLWGNRMLDHLISEFKKVFHDKNFVELPLDHEIFQGVFRLTEKPQVPSEDAAHEGAPFGITWETNIGEPDANLNTPHYKAILDDAGRIMILMCHNTDISDGWEEEGISEWFFTHFSEKYSYPMGINIIFYCLTH
ncbi:MAG: DUF4159 domain-containing protein [Verrucomicrobia bacterium]|nr:DUF4159 domain-containing protein [Verrucomicrobiota bacterium]